MFSFVISVFLFFFSPTGKVCVSSLVATSPYLSYLGALGKVSLSAK